uniref:PDZ domain containing 1 n=1 Tax=Callorhinchus milii TaxID=7868 RepID=A0A4W3ISM8_CALMI
MATIIQPRICKLTKQEGQAFGFFLRVEKDTDGHLIRSIVKESPAEQAGMRDGDRVLRVNDTFVDKDDHHQVVEKIKTYGNQVTFVVLDDVSYVNAKKQGSDLIEISNLNSKFIQPVINGVNGKTAQPKLCYLVKESSGYGFSLKSTEGIPGLFITEVSSIGVAAEAGVQLNDRLIELNGENVENFTHEQVVSKIKGAEDYIVLLLVDEESDKYFKNKKITIVAPMASVKNLPYQPRVADITKGPDGYGFYLRDEQGHQGISHYIRDIDPDSPAEKSGLVDGDCLVAVNGDDADQLEHEALVEKIKKCGSRTTFLVADSQTHELYKKAGISPICYWNEVCKPHRHQELEIETPNQTTEAGEEQRFKLRHIFKGDEGYGFILDSTEGVQKKFIKQVVAGSPAEKAGLEENDVLIEVNGVNVEGDTYDELVRRINQSGDRLSMLVIGREEYNLHEMKKIPTNSFLSSAETPELASPAAQTEEQSDGQLDGQSDKQSDRQIDKQMEESNSEEPIADSPPEENKERATSSGSST